MNEIVTKATFDNFESQSIPLCLNLTLKMREEKKKISKTYKNDSTEISTRNYRYTKKSILYSRRT